jgi:hypothetical protein
MAWIRSWAQRSTFHTLCFCFIALVVLSYLGNHLVNYIASIFRWHFRSTDSFLDTLGFAAIASALMTFVGRSFAKGARSERNH